MKNRSFYTAILVCLFGFLLSAQNSINDYKYIVVPDQYEFTSGKDKYQLNSLTKFLFNKYGYTAFMDGDEFPEDLKTNRCLALTSEVRKIKGFLKTKLQIDLLDCNGNTVMSSQIGESKEKEYQKAYHLALREAFGTYQAIAYKYDPSEAVKKSLEETKVASNSRSKEAEEAKAKIKELEKEVEALKKVKEKEEEVRNKLEKIKETTRPQKEEKPVVKEVVEEAKEKTNTNVLYAQPIDNGFQLVDTTPKKVMVILQSGVKDVFIVKGKDAVVYKKGNAWVYSENNGKGLKSENLNIKF